MTIRRLDRLLGLIMGDTLLFNGPDGGNIESIGGAITQTDGFETSVYLSMFGGNEGNVNYWGNIDEADSVNHYTSETGNILRSIPATTGNLIRVEDAVKNDTNWMLKLNIASSIDVTTSMPALNTVGIKLCIIAEGQEHEFNFTENWRASAE